MTRIARLYLLQITSVLIALMFVCCVIIVMAFHTDEAATRHTLLLVCAGFGFALSLAALPMVGLFLRSRRLRRPQPVSLKAGLKHGLMLLLLAFMLFVDYRVLRFGLLGADLPLTRRMMSMPLDQAAILYPSFTLGLVGLHFWAALALLFPVRMMRAVALIQQHIDARRR